MFDTHCPECDQRQLIFPSQIRQLINDKQGIVALFTCWCGAPGAERLSTASAHKPAATPDRTLDLKAPGTHLSGVRARRRDLPDGPRHATCR